MREGNANLIRNAELRVWHYTSSVSTSADSFPSRGSHSLSQSQATDSYPQPQSARASSLVSVDSLSSLFVATGDARIAHLEEVALVTHLRRGASVMRRDPSKETNQVTIPQRRVSKGSKTLRGVSKGAKPLWQECRGQRPLLGCRGEAPQRRWMYDTGAGMCGAVLVCPQADGGDGGRRVYGDGV